MSQTPSAVKTSHHPAWASLANMACEDIERLLEHFFSSTDNLLYDLSKRASTNSEAAFYFDAMRSLRLVRQDAIEVFCDRIRQQAMSLSQGQLSGEAPEQDLDLLSSDELDRALACETVINNVKGLYHDELLLLSKRMTQLSPLESIPRAELPFTPQWLANTFAMVLPQTSGKIAVILFKQLEKHLLRQLSPLLSQCNEFLVAEGLFRDSAANFGRLSMPKLSDIKTSLDDEPVAQASTPSQFALPLHALRQILANARFQAANDAHLGYRYSFNPGPVVPLPILSSALTQQQMQQSELKSFPIRNQVHDYVSRALRGELDDQPNALNPYHEDIIQLVDAFFDELLDDSELTPVTQSLVCRLQIPMLKIALRNENFFADNEHTARVFINRLTELSQSLDANCQETQDPLYVKLSNTVKRINKLFDLNESIFESELAEIEQLAEQELKRAQIIEQRTIQAEEGRARFESAKQAAKECLQYHTINLKLHPTIKHFIEEYWQQVLVLTFLKEGQGPEWLTHGQTLNDLLWLDQEHPDERSRQRAESIGQGLPDRLMIGLGLLHIAKDQSENLINSALDALGKPAERMAISAPATAITRQRRSMATLKQQSFDRVKDMTVGTWIRFEIGEQPMTCKLACNTSNDAFLFVNRLGMKKMTRSRKEVALDIQEGRATILNHEPMFDRLMSRALTHLKAN